MITLDCLATLSCSNAMFRSQVLSLSIPGSSSIRPIVMNIIEIFMVVSQQFKIENSYHFFGIDFFLQQKTSKIFLELKSVRSGLF